MQPVTKAGEQPKRCSVEECDRPPVSQNEVLCAGHLKYFQTHNGSATTAAIEQPDDPELLERLAAQAATNEAKEYAERRRVKTWRTLENGTRVPETYYTEAELAAMDNEAEEMVANLGARTIATQIPVSRDLLAESAYVLSGERPASWGQPEDPIKAGTKAFRRALKGKHGPAIQKMAEAFVEQLYER